MEYNMDRDPLSEENTINPVMRWIPRVVVIGTMAGFLGLAWYAYRTGTQSVRDEDLIIVEADKTPVKEKPTDPGGMKFPNQDKTIFETFASNTQPPPKVERLMPAPEEPMAKQLDTSDTKTWVNDKAYKQEAENAAPADVAKQEEIMAAPAKTVTIPVPPEAKVIRVPTEPFSPPKEVAKAEATKPARDSGIVSYTKKTVAAAPKPAPSPEFVKEEDAEETAPAKTEKKAVPSSGGVKVQLGAFGSEKEAKAAFAKMQKKISALAGKSPIIVRADLGDKGIFYRLRVGGFADDSSAASFCKSVSAKGQACIVPQ